MMSMILKCERIQMHSGIRGNVLWMIMVFMCMGLLTSIISCGKNGNNSITVSDLAKSNSLLYIEENDNLVPFIVVTDKYNNHNALLLRKEILQHDYRMNKSGTYYNGSEIDTWLNSRYLTSLGTLTTKINDTELVVTADSAIGYASGETESISRKVFLLSCEELGFDTSVNMAREGEMLSYFKHINNRIAFKDNQPAAWLLRTPNTYYLSGCYAVGVDGSLNTINSYDETGIRPAFCVDKSLEVLKERVSEEEYGYVLR